MQSYFPKQLVGSKDNSKKLNNETFCMAPWVHLHIRPDGEVRPCASYCGSSYGSLKQNSIEEIWNSDTIKKIRKDMVNGLPNQGCLTCYLYDKVGLLSERSFNNQSFFHHLDLVENTEDDGTCNEMRFIHWDITSSNLCNFKCRMCGPMNSIEWQKEQFGKYNYIKLDEKYFSDILDKFISSVEYIYFSGGEPTLIKNYYEILEKLIKFNNTEVTIDYNTNFSILDSKFKNIISLWKKFKNLQISMSIDGTGERGELIRSGFNWEKFLNNVKYYYSNISDKNLTALITVQALNSFHVIDLHRELFEHGIIKNIDHIILEFLTFPQYQSVWILPENIKNTLNLKIQDHIDNFIIPNGGIQSLKFFQSYQKYLFLRDGSKYVNEFKSKMFELDLIRGENVKEVFPELKFFWDRD